MKKTKLAVSTVLAAMAVSFTAMAGSWESTSGGWRFNEGNGSYTDSGWSWIDGNNDGIAECYYFSNGYCLMNTTTPDNYTVDSNGAWVINGVVQTKEVSATETSNQVAAQAVAEYRNALLNNTWNVKGIAAEQFAVVDIFNDEIPEVFVMAHDKTNTEEHAAYFSVLMSYNNGFKTIGSEYSGIEYFGEVCPDDGRINAWRTRGKDIDTLYQFDGNTLTELDSKFDYYLTEEEIQKANQTLYANLSIIKYVDMTQANLDTYLSGNGKETGV